MDQQTVHKTYKEKLRPTPAPERALEDVQWRCRERYNVALEGGSSASRPGAAATSPFPAMGRKPS